MHVVFLSGFPNSNCIAFRGISADRTCINRSLSVSPQDVKPTCIRNYTPKSTRCAESLLLRQQLLVATTWVTASGQVQHACCRASILVPLIVLARLTCLLPLTQGTLRLSVTLACLYTLSPLAPYNEAAANADAASSTL